jgi:hypothetical protein
MEMDIMSKLIDLGRVSRETMGGATPLFSENQSLQDSGSIVRTCDQNVSPFTKGVKVYEVPQAQGKAASNWINCT